MARFAGHGIKVGSNATDPHTIVLCSCRLTPAEHRQQSMYAEISVNNVPVDLCTKRGIAVFNTPGANANSVKELVLAALLLTSCDVLGGFDYMRSLTDVADDAELHRLVEREKRRFKGHEVASQTLGIVGLGTIGSRVARAALHLGMDMLGYDPKLPAKAAARLPKGLRRVENAAALFANSDCVTLHIPAWAENASLIDAKALAGFRPGAALINFARREIVDETAVKAALESGRLRTHFADFPSATMAADQICDFLRHGNVVNSVNSSAVTLEPGGDHINKSAAKWPTTSSTWTRRRTPQ